MKELNDIQWRFYQPLDRKDRKIEVSDWYTILKEVQQILSIQYIRGFSICVNDCKNISRLERFA